MCIIHSKLLIHFLLLLFHSLYFFYILKILSNKFNIFNPILLIQIIQFCLIFILIFFFKMNILNPYFLFLFGNLILILQLFYRIKALHFQVLFEINYFILN
jgi:hypothetical protein